MWRLGTLLAVVGLLAFTPTISAQSAPSSPRPTLQELTSTTAAGDDWFTYGGALNNNRFSKLDQINASNVSQLKGAWMTRLHSGRGSKYKFEADPIVIDGVMYIPSGNDDIFALDAKSGRLLWAWNSDIPQQNDTVCCGWDNRGVAVGDGKVYSGLLDGSFIALDQKTGQLAWRVQLEDYHDGYSMTGAFRYYDGLVFAGMSGGEFGIRGRVYALDAKTGNEVWRFYTVPAPGEPFSDTWPSQSDPNPAIRDVWQRGGATVWQAPAIDPQLGMLYFTTGNASPQEGSIRPGDNLFTASFLALDYKTGQYKWHFQQVHHEIWDYDAPSPVVLFDQTLNGQRRKGIYEPGKTGWVYFLDRTDGQPLIGMEEKSVPQEPRQFTAATQPYPVGDAFVNQCPDPLPEFPLQGCIYTPYWDVPVLNVPTHSGGSNFNPSSYDPNTGYAYVFGIEQDGAYAEDLTAPQEFQVGRSYRRVYSVPTIGAPINSTVTAMDSRTNKIVWQHRNPGEFNLGGVTTAGGLLFTGQVDGNMTAYDDRTGDMLWKFQVGMGISAPPMTYSVDGTQYLAVAAGGNRGGLTTLDGDEVWAFSLNGTVDELSSPPPIQTKVTLTGPTVKLGDPIVAPTAPTNVGVSFDGTIGTIDYDYLPRITQVPAGTTLTFTNNGSVIHTATERNRAFDTAELGVGQSVPVTFDTPGTYIYNCTPHPWMVGEVIVQ
jgi:alcohol dehydrogenase (cytochrome c)